MFTLYHTNDFHNHLHAAQAERLHALRQQVQGQGLLLDAGDAVGSGNVTWQPGGEPILRTMSEIGYDAMTVGNREFHVWRSAFHSKLSLARFPVLCANIRPSHQLAAESDDNKSETTGLAKQGENKRLRKDPPVEAWWMAETASGWRVIVFGLTVPMVTVRMLARKVSAYVFDDPIETAAQLAPVLKQKYQPDLLIALTHIGLSRDRALAASVPAIDLIVGGHSHNKLAQGERVGETLIVQADCFGHFVGKVEAEKAPNSSGRPSLVATLEAL